MRWIREYGMRLLFGHGVRRRYGSKRGKCICKVAGLENDGFIGKFLKRVPQTNKFTITDEENLVSSNDIILKLSSPVSCSSA